MITKIISPNIEIDSKLNSFLDEFKAKHGFTKSVVIDYCLSVNEVKGNTKENSYEKCFVTKVTLSNANYKKLLSLSKKASKLYINNVLSTFYLQYQANASLTVVRLIFFCLERDLKKSVREDREFMSIKNNLKKAYKLLVCTKAKHG
ncbi:hypothetical protein [Helicobacter sp. 11S02629-2]|uniref:hypothetical protein n=1 Tax=Helicobacter sp. 11S02629-2 TaxID=1476195 RepID=UPI000BA5F847|nr:hypothetical protein [Helicobacter sp. 11S02629-2]PAF42737.1 hypothetical protein BKH40_07530 [Helicobacter sp. 11S02629-2]